MSVPIAVDFAQNKIGYRQTRKEKYYRANRWASEKSARRKTASHTAGSPGLNCQIA
jgi:hypothetical protein